MKKISIALFLSLLFHLSQFGLVSFFYTPPQSHIDASPTEIELIETPTLPAQKNESKPIVRTIQEKNPPVIDPNRPAEFLAEVTNRTIKQTRAQEYGKFQNSQKSKSQQQLDEASSQFTQQLNMPSRSEYELPEGIQQGNATNLNTDAHIYASFYNRVTDLFYIRWAQKLDSLWTRLSGETKRSLSGRVWSTEVEILLNPQGKYEAGLIMKRSGFGPFDAAAINAFKDANFFPNPPRGKVEADGRIHLRYRISVHVRN